MAAGFGLTRKHNIHGDRVPGRGQALGEIWHFCITSLFLQFFDNYLMMQNFKVSNWHFLSAWAFEKISIRYVLCICVSSEPVFFFPFVLLLYMYLCAHKPALNFKKGKRHYESNLPFLGHRSLTRAMDSLPENKHVH